MNKPIWWLEKPHKLDLTPCAERATFSESDLFGEYLKRGMDDVMDFQSYKLIRMEVIDVRPGSEPSPGPRL